MLMSFKFFLCCEDEHEDLIQEKIKLEKSVKELKKQVLYSINNKYLIVYCIVSYIAINYSQYNL